MFRFMLTEKFVVGSIIFLILFCIGAVIWYQYNTETYRKELTESFELHDQTENKTQQTEEMSVEANTLDSEESVTLTTNDISDMSDSDETLQEKNESDETITVAGRVIRLSDIPDVPEVSPMGLDHFQMYQRIIKEWLSGDR